MDERRRQTHQVDRVAFEYMSLARRVRDDTRRDRRIVFSAGQRFHDLKRCCSRRQPDRNGDAGEALARTSAKTCGSA
jgi:hypothetical protein